MLVKLLGVLDIFIAIFFWLFGIFYIIPGKFILVLGFVLLVKGLVFIFGLSIMSFLDIVTGIIIILATSIEMPYVVVIIIALFLLQKGILSLL